MLVRYGNRHLLVPGTVPTSSKSNEMGLTNKSFWFEQQDKIRRVIFVKF